MKLLRKVLDLRAFDLVIWFYGLLIEISVKRLLIAGAMAGMAFGAYQVRPIVRDAAVAVYAHQRAGEAVPFNPDYSLAAVIPSEATWGIEVNSTWLVKAITYIVPYFAYENIAGNPVYPDGAYFLPREGVSSFMVGGQMHPASWRNGGGWLQVNERYFADPYWLDERGAFGTLVHELVHVQGGVFLAGSSAELESATVAATTEMLAAMCIYQNDLACGAFWSDIEGLALVSLASRLPEGVYDLFSDVYVRDADERAADAKNDRFWAGNEAQRQEIREKYGRHPWEARVLPGVLEGRRLHTLTENVSPRGALPVGFMAYDDTAALLGWPMRLLLWLTTVGSEGG